MKFPRATEIRKIRKGLDITQTELANASGVSQSTIAKIERGKISASYDTVVSLFDTLERMKQSRAEDVLAIDVASKNLITIQSNEKVHAATELMRSTGFSQLPVLTGEIPVGSISERSIFDLLRTGRTMEDLKDSVIYSIMDDSFPLVNENTPISAVTSIMSNYDAVLVGSKGKIVGMITNSDLLKLL